MSASENYHNACREMNRKRININKIRKRWFKNYYVLYQSEGYFKHDTYVFKFGEIDPNKYEGSFYGPFYKDEASTFASDLESLHTDFILG